MKPIIAFDIDGVLIDSERESILTSWNEHNIWLKSKGLKYEPFTVKLSDVPQDFKTLYGKFRKHSNKSHYRIAINRLISRGDDPDKITSEEVQQISESNQKEVYEVNQRIKEIRCKQHNEVKLSEIYRAYEAVDYSWIKHLYNNRQVYFVTNNPGSLVGLGYVAFKPDISYIRTNELGITDKSLHLNEIIKKEKIAASSILFIDDSLLSLQEVKKGTDIPVTNIIHNTWAPKSRILPANSGFPDLDFDEIKSFFNNLHIKYWGFATFICHVYIYPLFY